MKQPFSQMTLAEIPDPKFPYLESTAEYDESGKYRFTLYRVWNRNNPRRMAFIGLNPSTATEFEDDPTVRRCAGFAKSWGYGGFWMLNLFPLRSTDPNALHFNNNMKWMENIQYILKVASMAEILVLSWGNHGLFYNGKSKYFSEDLLEILIPKYSKKLRCLGVNKTGAPKHPLYLKSDTKLVPLFF